MGQKKNYTQEQMLEAIEAVKKGTPAAAAAKEFNVPRATLVYKASGKSPTICRFGPPTVLTDAEEIIKQWILHAARLQYPITKELLCDSVQHIIKTMERPNPFNDGRPGRKWYEAFFRRHPELRERTVQPLTSARSGVTEEQLRNWFAEIKKYLEEKELFNITNEPRRVFNADESAFFLQPSGGKVITRKGEKNVYSANNNDEKENLTVLVTANAAGDIAPPMIVFSYERIPSHIASSVPPSWGIGKSESGWMCGSVFYEYITNIFLPWLVGNGIQRPVLLFIDGHVSHLTLHLSEFCSENGIELISLYPNSTHLLQPMDVAVFHPLKATWRKEVRKWRVKHFGNKLKKENFAPVLSKCIDQILETTRKNGFKACGLCPFDVEQVDFKKIASATKPVQGTAISDERVKDLEKGICFLESNISKEKVANFIGNYEHNLWTGSVEDTSLFYLWRNAKKQLEMCSRSNVEDNDEHEAEVVTDPAVSEEARNETFAHSEIQPPAGDVADNDAENVVLVLGEEIIHEEIQPSSHSILSSVPSTSDDPTMSRQETQNNSASIPSSSSKSNIPENIPSPFKRALFWPDPQLSKSKKRKAEEKIPSAITSEVWQKYHKKKEEEKLQKQKEKEERANIRLEKRTQKELQKPQKNNKKRLRSPISSDDSEEWVESGDSMDDLDILEESDENDYCELLDKEGVNVDDFVLAKFTSGKRKSTIYRYVCIIQNIFDDDGDVEVMCLKCLNDDKKMFKSVESDVSVIKKEDIIGKLPPPKYLQFGDRIKYQFNHAIDIYEQL